SEMALAERNDPVETFFVQRPHEAFRVGVRVWRLKRCLHDADPALRESVAHGRAPLRIPVADQHPTRGAVRHRERSHNLVHERVVRMWRDAQTCTRRVARSMTNTV